jgi:hypothetical protein
VVAVVVVDGGGMVAARPVQQRVESPGGQLGAGTQKDRPTGCRHSETQTNWVQALRKTD